MVAVQFHNMSLDIELKHHEDKFLYVVTGDNAKDFHALLKAQNGVDGLSEIGNNQENASFSLDKEALVKTRLGKLWAQQFEEAIRPASSKTQC